MGSFTLDDVVINQGEPADRMFIVDSGKFAVFQTDRKGVRKELEKYKRDAAFGVLSLMMSAPSVASVVCVSKKAQVWCLDAIVFRMTLDAIRASASGELSTCLKSVEMLKVLVGSQIRLWG